MGLPELKAALVEARNAVEIADEKSKIAHDMAWEMAAEAAGEAGEGKSLDSHFAVARELDKLPRRGFQPCVFYNEPGDMMECYWKNCASVSHWLNHAVSIRKCAASPEDEGHEDCGGRVTGVTIHWAKMIFERSGTLITPDLPNPSKAVEAAKELGICRVCRKELKVGTAPAAVKERFGSQVYGDSIVFNCGEEYAHQACLNMEAKGVHEGID